jgi:hypothetical protein
MDEASSWSIRAAIPNPTTVRANRSWAGGNWGDHHRRNFFIGGLGGLYAFSGYPYDCYNWPYHYGPPYDSCYGYGYGF